MGSVDTRTRSGEHQRAEEANIRHMLALSGTTANHEKPHLLGETLEKLDSMWNGLNTEPSRSNKFLEEVCALYNIKSQPCFN